MAGVQPAVGREELVGAVVGGVRRQRATLLRGAWAAGTSTVLLAVVDALADRGVAVVHRIAGEPDLAAALAGPATSVLVVDDAHRLAPDDAGAVRRRALDAPGSVVLGARAGAPLPDPLAWLEAAGALDARPVPPLVDAEVVELLAAHLGGAVHGGASRALAAAGGGRPGFVVDLADDGLADGWLVHRNGLWRTLGLPVGGEVLGRRADRELAGLDRGEREALEALAVAGPVALDVALGVVDGADLDRLVARGVVGVADGVATDPPALGATVAQRLGPGRAAALGAHLLAASTDPPLAQRVRWQVVAGRVPVPEDVEAAVGEALRADDVAWALRLAAAAPPSPSSQWLLAQALAADGRPGEASAVLEQLADLPGVPDDLRFQALSHRASVLLWDLSAGDRALAITEGFLDVDAGALSNLLRVNHGASALYTGDPARAAEVVGPALDDELGGGGARATLAAARALLGSAEEAVALARAAVDHPAAPQDPPTGIVALVLALSEAGWVAEAHEVVVEAYEEALAGSRTSQAWMALCRLRVALLTGDVAEARHLGLEAAETFADLDEHATLRWSQAGRAIAAAYADRPDEAAEAIEALDALGPSAVRFLEPDVVRARAWGAAAHGDLVTAREHAAAAADLARATGAATLEGMALHDLVRLGGVADAAGRLEALADGVGGPWAPLRCAHARALLGDDVEELLGLVDGFAALGAALHAAEAAADAVAAARRRGDAPVVRRATAALARARAVCPAARTPALVGVHLAPLSPRERQVAEAAAAGRASRAIAEDLGVSVRTVDNLLQRAYTKLGVHRRQDLGELLRTGP